MTKANQSSMDTSHLYIIITSAAFTYLSKYTFLEAWDISTKKLTRKYGPVNSKHGNFFF